jgi:hypothetical protein
LDAKTAPQGVTIAREFTTLSLTVTSWSTCAQADVVPCVVEPMLQIVGFDERWCRS